LLGAPFGSQQLFSAEHDDVLGLQIDPASRHAVPLSQRPNSCVGLDFAHVTGPFSGGGAPDHPQQSLSLRQISPVGAQPEGGWQIMKPGPAPVGAHTREQHPEPQLGTVSPTFAQTVPFTEQFVVPGALTVAPHVPSRAPPTITQFPPQQSAFVAQTSPCCVQNESPLAEQRPLLHRPEQHSVLPPHGLPDVLHVVLSGLHFIAPVPSSAQLPPQHSSFVVHAWLSAVHCLVEH
jgi:hypothetical protein